MKPQTPQDYADWKDSTFLRARRLIAAEPVSFRLAGQQLAETFSCELIHRLDAGGDESPRQSWPPGRLFLTRICHARSAAIGQSSDEFLNLSFDFRFSGGMRQRLSAARQAILAILIAADPDANDYISPDMCELAKLQYETQDGKILGRGYVPWDWNESDKHLCPSLNQYGCPTPHTLSTLEGACKLIESSARQKDQNEPCTGSEAQPAETKRPDHELIQLEPKEIGVLRWLADPTHKNRQWKRCEVLPDDPHTPTDPRRLRSIINHLHDLGLLYSPPRSMVKITQKGLEWLQMNSEAE